MGFSAAEVERYVYCPLSWALAKRGHEGAGDSLKEGESAHGEIGKRISVWRRVLKEHYDSLQVAFYLALTAASAATLALEVVFLDFQGHWHWALLMMSLFWLLLALGFLLRAMFKEEEAKQFVEKAGLVAGELAYSDLDRPGETLRSEKFGVSGKPDYIVRRGQHYIPVELKTGRTPESPHPSHLAQLGVYCLLVEDCYGTRPTHGVLQYPEKTFEVAFSDRYREQVIEATLRMKLATMTGVIHRTHERPGKCRGCSRRDACPERLA